VVSAKRAFDIGIESSFSEIPSNDSLIWCKIFPVNDKQKEKDGDEHSNDELEEMIPNIVDKRSNFLSNFSSLLSIVSFEKLEHIFICERTIELNCFTHCFGDNITANSQRNTSKGINEYLF
jgi:hypothetical protein